MISPLLFLLIWYQLDLQNTLAAPEAKIKVKISDIFLDQVASKFENLLTSNAVSWSYSLNFDDQFMTMTKNGQVSISEKPTVQVSIETEKESGKIYAKANLPDVNLAWSYDLYYVVLGYEMFWGKARCHYRVNNLAIRFLIPGINLRSEHKQSGFVDYSLELEGPVLWNVENWSLEKWSFLYELGQGEDYGAKLMTDQNQTPLLKNLTRSLVNCSADVEFVSIVEASNFINSSITRLPKLSTSEPLLKVNNNQLARLNVSQMYDYASIGIYTDNHRSMWFVINLKSQFTNRTRRSDEPDFDIQSEDASEQPSRDLSVDVMKVPYKIELENESVQIKALNRLRTDTFVTKFKEKMSGTETLKDQSGKTFTLTGHSLHLEDVRKKLDSMVRDAVWEFNTTEIDNANDFFGTIQKHSVQLQIEATKLNVSTFSNGTSFYHFYESTCFLSQMQNESYKNSGSLPLQEYVSAKVVALENLLSTVNANMSIEWKVNLPAQFEYSKLKSDWTVYDDVLDVQVQSNIL